MLVPGFTVRELPVNLPNANNLRFAPDGRLTALGYEGNFYFGLIVADYSNAYRLRKRKDLKPEERAWLEARGDRGGDPEDQVSLYDIHSKRGTIQKWNRSTSQLETIATGIRVPY